MSVPEYTPAQILIIKAAEDEQTLANDLPDTIVGFHAQQAVEKLIKALLSALDIPFEKTHDLFRLNKLLDVAGEVLPATP